MTNFKKVIQDCNLNLLIGSGLSVPFFKTLGGIETMLTALEERDLPPKRKELIRASLYKHYFDVAINRNLELIAGDLSDGVLENYRAFMRSLNTILLKRKSTILDKEINLFTTNVDIFLERALEDVGLEFNDGFNGRFLPSFSLSNFKKSRFKKSLHYDNTAELPVFNLLKLHGALTWETSESDRIVFSNNLRLVSEIKKRAEIATNLIAVSDGTTLDSLISSAQNEEADSKVSAFVEAYDRLAIVNPTKAKFKHTLLNQIYYELLRLYSNELEKENTVLFAMGFSFADEHIREITLRAANSNPTLLIYIIAYNEAARADIASRFPSEKVKNENIKIVSPPRHVPEGKEAEEDKFQYDLPTITLKIFDSLFSNEFPIPDNSEPASEPF